MNKAIIVTFFLMLISCGTLTNSKSFKMKLYVFDCGENVVKDISLFSPGVDKNISKKLVASCYLIKHPKGTLMWDTGLSDSLISKVDGDSIKNGAFTLKVKKTLISQMNEIGIAPNSIKYLAFSHMHPDHTGNANLFQNATVMIQASEFNAAFGSNPGKYSFNKKTYEKLNINNFKKLNGDFDVFGDGRVVIKHAEGHTPGHQVLFVDLPKTGAIVLSGDLYHFKKNRTHRRVPIFNWDKEMTLKSMEKIEKFLAAKSATLWIQHDPVERKSIHLAPSFYQ